MSTLQLENSALHAEVLLKAGGGLLRLNLLHDCDVTPISRPGIVEATLHGPGAFACSPLVPWSSRIGGGWFPFRGRAIEVPHTYGDEPYPLHGHGWLMPWHPVSQTAISTEFVATVDHGRPFHYLALQHYALVDSTLNIMLAVRNKGSPLLFGLGAYPFFPCTPDVQLRAGAVAIWQPAPDNLPTVLNAPSAGADFRELRRLEASATINHSSKGWDGRAEIV